MKRSTAVLLVCLRLAIGWHFAVEGWQKIRATDLIGPAETSRPFSSEAYFREGQGPLGRFMRWQMGDPDQKLLAFLTPLPMPADKDPAQYPAQYRMPAALGAEWDDYAERFAQHYTLDATQQSLVESKLQQQKHDYVTWLTIGQIDVVKKFPTGEIERQMPVAERIGEYRAKVQELRDTYDKKLPAFGQDVEKQRLQKLKAEVADLRANLAAELEKKQTEFEANLAEALTAEQKKLGPVPAEPGREPSAFVQKVRRAVRGQWWAEAADRPEPPLTQLEIVNALTRWGVFLIGVGLLVGLFTRFWCVLGAGFLLLTYLTAPPFPWWPAPPQTEGNYLFVNKNVIEMLGLMVLATTASGRWLGLDALVRGIFTGFREESAEQMPAQS
jgi:uncharacterized membrane protein YphA (DoxX/SURF4 family)